MTAVDPRPPIERRLREAGLPPLPRTAWLEIDLDALRGQPRGRPPAGRPGRAGQAGRQGRCLRSRRVAGGARARGGRRRRVLRRRRSTRRSRSARAASAAPILVLYPVPAAFVGEAARLGIAVAGGDLAGLAETAAAAAGLDPARPLARRPGGRDRARPGRVRRARPGRCRPAGRGDRPGLALSGLWTHFQAVEDPATTAAQVARFDAAVAAVAAAGIALPPRHVVGERGAADRRPAGLRGRPAGPVDLRPRPRRARPGDRRRPRGADLRPVMSLLRAPGPGRRPAERAPASATGRPSGRPVRAGSRRCRSATATAGRGRCRTGRARSSAGGASRWSGTWRWTR